MFDAAAKAISQMFTPPFRTVLWKSIGLAILILILLAFGLHRLFGWFAGEGAHYLEGLTGPGMQTPLHALLWVLAIMAGFGLFAGAIFIMPAVTSFVASFFSDEIAAEVEHVHYPADPPGVPVPVAPWQLAQFCAKTVARRIAKTGIKRDLRDDMALL